MLTRLSFTDGSYLASLDSLPRTLRWTEEEIERSMRLTLASIQQDSDVWIFGYGSLIWNPLTVHTEQRRASLAGWHRKFCQKLIAGRGAAHTPGRMLGLLAGGRTEGIAYRLDAKTRLDELRLVWTREMAMGSYRPIWRPLSLECGRSINGLVFVADESHPHHVDDDHIDITAELIAEAQGPWGSNADYVFRLDAALDQHDMRDPYIRSIAKKVRERLRPFQRAADRTDHIQIPLR